MIDEIFINSNPSYYTYYPYLFNNAFGIHDKNVLETLTLAGFFYYKAIINVDSIFDKKNPENVFNKYVISNICQEETIKLLSSLFHKTHPFWELWNLRKLEYLKAFEIDKKPKKITSYNDYETLADYKCAFGKIAIDSLFYLSEKKDKKLYNSILKSHKFFYVGFQIIDDITDFIEDIENGQFNILHFELEKIKDKAYIARKPLKGLKTQLFLDGTISKVQNTATNNLEKALSYVKNLDLDQWKSEIQNLFNTSLNQQLNTIGFINVFKTKQNLSNTIITTNTPQNSLNKATNFIIKAQQQNGSWNDYFNEAGVSNTWATAFILNYFPKNTINPQTTTINNAIEYLKQTIGTNMLWGYNSSWISDADSSSFVMLSFIKFNHVIKSETIKKWLSYQNIDGGFSTYNNESAIKISLNNTIENVDGWTQSHFCVSATAYYTLSQLKTKKKCLVKLRRYILKTIKSKKNHHSYWWTDFIYTLAFLIKGAEINNDTELLMSCNDLIKKHIKGSGNSNLFYQGLLLDCICSSDYLFDKYENKTTEIVSQLLKNQFSDGSWQENFSLRIPEPGVIHPENKNIVWTKSDKGTNIILSDYHRLFTTTVCLSGLSKYYSLKKNFDTKKELVVNG